jgi:predicted lipoprotein
MIIKITATLTAALLCGCPPTVKPEPGGDLKRQVLKQVTERVVLPTLDGFIAETEVLGASATQWSEARRTGPALAERDAVRTAFKTAFLRWERAEMMAFGPAGKPPTFSLGQGLRDTIYAWPTINPCRVDEVLAGKLYEGPTFFDTALVTSTGLAAIEQLVFVDGAGNACPPTDPINTTGTWAAMSADELAVRRADYAKLAIAAMLKQARALQGAWVNDASRRYATAGLADSGFATAQAALNEVFAALFQADLALKNARIGVPLGLVPATCATVPCPAQAEALPSRFSREAIGANLDGLRAVMRGDFDEPGHGFDVLLGALGAGALATDMDAALVTARAQADGLAGPIDALVVSDPASVQLLHDDVKVFTDLLKNQFITVLSLQVPAEGAGDAD